MAGEEIQNVKLQVGLLQQEIEARGKQIESLLTKLDSTADKIVELTVEIKSLNSRQERHSKVDDEIRSELKLLHTRIGNVHDEIGHSERRVSESLHKVEERVRQVEQYKSKLMGMIVVVGGAVGLGIASLMGLLNVFKE
jgi:chromosome segregation ATPase